MNQQQLIAENKKYPDQMTHSERMAAYWAGQEVDRLPVAISARENLAPLYGISLADYRRDFNAKAFVYQQAVADFDCYGISIGPNLKRMGEALGAIAHYPADGPDYLTDLPLLDYAALPGFSVPNPIKSPVLAQLLDEIAAYKHHFGDDFPISTEIGGPLSTAISIRPLDDVLLDFSLQPQQLLQLLSFAVSCQLAWVEAVHSRFGISSINIAEPVASSSLISPSMFSEFVAPAMKQLVQGVKRLTGKKPALHICGKTKPIWPQIKALGFASFRVDNCESLTGLKAALGDEICLVGNVDPVAVMQQGSIDTVLAAAKRCIEQAADSPAGFILAAGCQLPPGVSADNLQALLLAARKYGRRARLGQAPLQISR